MFGFIILTAIVSLLIHSGNVKEQEKKDQKSDVQTEQVVK